MKSLKAILVVLAVASLAGCVVVPERGYYSGGYYHHSYDNWRYR